MKKNKIFVACDTTNISKIKRILKETQHSKIKFGYKFGLEFLNSKNGRSFLSKLKNKINFADLKIHDIPNTCVSTIKAITDLTVNYVTTSKKIPKYSSTIKIGSTNLLNNLHYEVYGGPYIGRMNYISILFELK